MLIDTTRCFGSVTSPYSSVGCPLVAAPGPDRDEAKNAASWVGVTGALTPATAVTVGAGPGVGPMGTVGAVDAADALALVAGAAESDPLLLHAASAATRARATAADFMCTNRE